ATDLGGRAAQICRIDRSCIICVKLHDESVLNTLLSRLEPAEDWKAVVASLAADVDARRSIVVPIIDGHAVCVRPTVPLVAFVVVIGFAAEVREILELPIWVELG